MSFTESTSGVLVLLLTVTAVCSQDGWSVTYSPSPICALKGSTVEIRCDYTYPDYLTVQEKFLFTKVTDDIYVDLMTDPEYSNRVQYQCENKVCHLTITDLRESDSAEYKFRFITNQVSGKFTGSPGVTLSVTDLKVHVNPGRSYFAECQSSCYLPESGSYIWYRNDQEIREETQRYYNFSLDSTNSLSCSIKGHEKSRSPTLTVKDIWGWTCTSNQICAVTGSTVKIHCTYRYKQTDDRQTVQERLWYTMKGGKTVDLKKVSNLRDRVQFQCNSDDCTLTILNFRDTDSAEYKFRFIFNKQQDKYVDSPGVTLSVTDPQLQIIVRRSTQSSSWTELTCHSDCQLPGSYIWFKNEQRLIGEKKYFLLQSFNPADRFHCDLKGYKRFPSPAVYASNDRYVSVSLSGELVENNSVTLTCTRYANPAAKYTWYKKHGNQDFKQLSEKPKHVFSSIKSSDSGVYYCTAGNELRSSTSSGLEINVKYPPKSSSVSASPSGPIEEGKPLSLTCSSDANPAASYAWYKDNKLLSGSKHVHYVAFMTSKDRGNYLCMSRNHLGQRNSSSLFVDVLYAPKLPSVSMSPSGEIVEGSSVTLTCSSDANPAANYTWYKDSDQKPVSVKSQLVFSSIKRPESGLYNCKAFNNRGRNTSDRVSIDVKYAPDLPSVSMSPSGEIVEGSSVTLTCSSDANPAANYIWYKQDEKSPKASGQNFTINNIKHHHSGNYYCKVQNRMGHKSSTIHVVVASATWKSVATGTTVFIFLIIILFIVLFLIKKQKLSQPSPEPGKQPDTSEQCQPHQSEEQEDLQYASVRFLRNQNDCLYMNFRTNGACRPRKEEIENVEYAAVKLSPRTEAREAVEDPSAVYSVVNKFT